MHSLRLEPCSQKKTGYLSSLVSWGLHKICRKKDIISLLAEWSPVEEISHSAHTIHFKLALLKANGGMTRDTDFISGLFVCLFVCLPLARDLNPSKVLMIPREKILENLNHSKNFEQNLINIGILI